VLQKKRLRFLSVTGKQHGVFIPETPLELLSYIFGIIDDQEFFHINVLLLFLVFFPAAHKHLPCRPGLWPTDVFQGKNPAAPAVYRMDKGTQETGRKTESLA
jgi:hypothetical protein